MRRLRLPFSSILILLSLLAGAASANELEKTTSTPRMPSPNAFNFYIQAGEVIPDSDKLEEIAVNNRSKVKKPSDASLQTLLKENARALKLLRLGFGYPYRHPVIKDFLTQGPEYSHFRNLARLLVLEGESKERKNDMQGAVNSYLDGMRLGIDTPQGGGVIAAMVGWACESISRRPLWKVAEQLNTDMARSTMTRIVELNARRVSLSESFQEEKRIATASVPALIQNMDDENETNLAPHTQQIIENIAGWMDETSQRLRQPYALREPVVIPIDPVSQSVLPVAYKRTAFNEARILTDNALLIVTLALQIYHNEHKDYPATLEQLVPLHLKKVPADPYGNGKPLRYHKTQAKYLLYSIGPDGKDDSGKAITNNEEDGTQRHSIRIESQGDYVAGINY